jgi:hypothetical protein
MEIWAKIPGFENRYSVSSWGRVRNDENGQLRKLTKMKRGVGYWIITLKENGKGSTLYIHHLVSAAFNGPTPKGEEIRHRDGNCDNNKNTNLIFGTRAQNLADKKIHGTQTRGEKHCTAKLTEAQVLEIRNRATKETYENLAKEYGVATMTVWKAATGKTWAHLPGAA